VYPRIAKEPVTLSLITIVAIALTIQAAFPILVNYILSVVALGTLRRFIEFLVYLPARIQGKNDTAIKEGVINEPSVDEIFLDELTPPLLSVYPADGRKIKKYMGVVGGEAVAEEKESKGIVCYKEVYL